MMIYNSFTGNRNGKVLGMIESIVNVFLGKAKLTDWLKGVALITDPSLTTTVLKKRVQEGAPNRLSSIAKRLRGRDCLFNSCGATMK